MATAAVMLIGAAISAYGSYQQGQAADQAAKHNAKISNQNAVIAKRNAAREAAQVRKSNYSREASLLATQGASGMKSGTGSFLDVLASTAREGEIEAREVEYGGQLESRSYRNDASLELFKGASAKQAGYIGAASSVASGTTNFLTRTG